MQNLKVGIIILCNMTVTVAICWKIESEFWKMLKTRENRTSDTSTLKDIYDGTEYRQLSKRGGFLCPTTNPANISFVLNTDGVSLFKSSETSVWPIFLVINELPANIR